MGALLALLGGIFAKFLTIDMAKFLAMRALLLSLFTLVLPVVLYKLFVEVLDEIMQYSSDAVSGAGMSSTIMDLTGFAGWIAAQMNLSASLAIFFSALALRYTLSMIPFIGR